MSEITNNRPNDNIQTPVIFDIKFAGTLRYFRTILELMTLLVLRAWRHSPHGQILSPRLYYTDREIEGTFYFQGYVIDPGSRLSCIPHTDISPSPPTFQVCVTNQGNVCFEFKLHRNTALSQHVRQRLLNFVLIYIFSGNFTNFSRQHPFCLNVVKV